MKSNLLFALLTILLIIMILALVYELTQPEIGYKSGGASVAIWAAAMIIILSSQRKK